MSEFKRPPGVSEDPEFCYRSGYQHGAWAVTLTNRRSLAVFPNKRTVSSFVGMSQTCQQQKLCALVNRVSAGYFAIQTR
jgi:hypothetical protein